MREIYGLLGIFFIGAVAGCGSSSSESSSPAVGADVMQRYRLTVQAQPVETTAVSLPLQFTDADWSSKQALCQEASYDLTPYAGQTLSLTRYTLNQKFYSPTTIYTTDVNGIITGTTRPDPLPLYLWVLSKDTSTVCSYTSIADDSQYAQELLHNGTVNPLISVNDKHIR